MKLIVEKDGELLDYLYSKLDMPKKRIKQYLTHGAIFVNNNRTTKYNLIIKIKRLYHLIYYLKMTILL